MHKQKSYLKTGSFFTIVIFTIKLQTKSGLVQSAKSYKITSRSII